MKAKAVQISVMVMAVAVLSGCQTGPRWAWWKHDGAPDASAVARSAEPVLPSAQATPQAVAVAGLTPAAPPSSANLAAAGAAAPAPNIAIPVTPGTVANAPPANYPAGNSLADKLTSAPNAMAKPANAALPSTAAPTPPASLMSSQSLAAGAGPYDPKGYKPGVPSASAGADPLVAASTEPDRYGMSNHYSAPSSVSTAGPPSNGYGSSVAAATPAAPVASRPLAQQAPAAMSDRYSMPVASAAAAPISAAPLASGPFAPAATTPVAPNPLANSTAAVNLAAAPGQYRPGGTSNYTAGAPARPIEVATRPTPAPASNAPAQTSAPAATSAPWAPPASPLPTAGTRTY